MFIESSAAHILDIIKDQFDETSKILNYRGKYLHDKGFLSIAYPKGRSIIDIIFGTSGSVNLRTNVTERDSFVTSQKIFCLK